MFPRIPEDAILSHNAEHHGFSNGGGLHVNSPGSSYCSGNINVHNDFHLNERGFFIGFGGTWQELFQGIIDQLDYPDGGGVVINHPTWFSSLADDFVIEMLDFDERVIGMEIYNHLSYGYTQNGKRPLDFCNEESCYGVDVIEEPVYGMMHIPWYRGDQYWWKPVFKSAQSNLRQAYNDWKAGKLEEKGKLARKRIEELHSYKKVGEAMKARLESLPLG